MQNVDSARLEHVRKRAAEWAHELIELNHTNTLVNFKRPKTASLELTGCPPEALTKLLSGNKSAIRTLFPGDDAHREACRRARNLHRKITGFREEQGIEVGKLACGLVRVPRNDARRTGVRPPVPLSAPLLLHTVTIAPSTVTGSDFSLQISLEAELNPVLLHALQREYGLQLGEQQPEALEDDINTSIAELPHSDKQVDYAFNALNSIAVRQHLGLELDRATVVGLFNYQKMPMVRDLESATGLLAANDLVAAMAKWPSALQALEQAAGEPSTPTADQIEPHREYLAQDADSSQQAAIEAALAGHHLIIEGPPGTGKSQTIANIIAGAAAAGKRVLFVAEKRAAIEAVTERLDRVDLGGLVLDLHRTTINKKHIAEQLSESLTRLTQQPPVDARELHRGFTERRERLSAYARELHRRRAPWGRSSFDVQEELLDDGSASGVDRPVSAIRGRALHDLDESTALALEDELQEFVELGGLRILRRESPWWRTDIRREDPRQILARLDGLARGALRDGQHQMHRLLAGVGLPIPTTYGEWQPALELLDGVAASTALFGPAGFGELLDPMVQATAPRAVRKQYPNKLPWLRRRALVKQARQLCTGGITEVPALHRALAAAQQQRHTWVRLSGGRSAPVPAAGLAEMTVTYRHLRTELAAVALSAKLDSLERMPLTRVNDELESLRADRDTLFKLRRITELRDRFTGLALDPLLAELAERNPSAGTTRKLFRSAWLRGLHDEFRLTSTHLAEFDPDRHDRLVREFQDSDREHRASTPDRVRRAVAVRVRKAKDEYPEQARLLRQEAGKKRRLKPLRTLVAETSDVLLTLRPCWAMSPLVVSRTLPATELFDLVIFDEASQVKPHDAITSIMRGKRLVVAGDEKQLPPTNFFDRQLTDAGETEEPDQFDLGDYESILGSLRGLVPSRRLRWHYRSEDERLIAFSNREIYQGDLVTFPGARLENPLRLEVVPGTVSPGTGGLPDEEVRRMVELVMEHAEQRPDESLGVITLGTKHQERVDGAIRQARAERRDLDEFFTEDAGPNKRFFVKSIETVQGDERDAIILSVGVAPRADGKVNRLGFGPLNQEVGARRLNVAITRARRRMTVVCAFPPHALAPSETVNGTELLRRFLEVVESERDPDEVGRSTGTGMNGFERAIARRLTEAKIPVHPQWGVSDHRIDFALAHPKRPGQMVLALEADGDRYHRSVSARDRDRLRQEHLERLGWRFHRVWASAWFADPDTQTKRIVDAWLDAVRASDTGAAVQAERPAERPRSAGPRALNRGPRPPVPPGLKTPEYTDRQLIDICFWLMRDGLALDRAERLEQARTELGFRKSGKVIDARLTRAIEIAQHAIDRAEP